MSDLDAIRDRIDIVELVGETVRLQKSGRTWKGLCPFHTEKTPSFIVNPERRTWHCFGSCGSGGDAFSFLMRRDHLDFREALQALASRAGVALSAGGAGSRSPQEEALHTRLIQANEAAAGYFHHLLLNSTEAAPARAYAERRGLDAATLSAFEIGYAPEGWDGLGAYLRGREFSAAELVQAGLSVEGERGSHDRFRARLMFPIRDERGRVTGFGGRALGDGLPKYLNSPQSPVFDKGSLLYALDRARETIRREDGAVIVEGYLDAITAHQFGYTNVVATLGTAITDRHIALIKRYARRVALALDADAAGVEAALRGEQLVRELGDGERGEIVVEWAGLVRRQGRAPVELRLFSVPAGKDPDEAIRAEPAAWPGWVAAALPPFEFRLRYELDHTDRSNSTQRLAALDRMLPLLAEVGDRALQAGYLSQLALALGFDEDQVRLRLNETLPAARRGQAVLAQERVQRAVAAGEPPALGRRTERFCLTLLLRFPELRPVGLQLSPDVFLDTSHRLLFDLWRAHEELTESQVAPELCEAWLALHAARIVPAVAADPAAALGECLQRLALRRLGEQKRLLTAAIAEQRQEADALVGVAADAPLDSAATPLAGQMRADVETGRSLHSLEYELRMGREPPAPSEHGARHGGVAPVGPA